MNACKYFKQGVERDRKNGLNLRLYCYFCLCIWGNMRYVKQLKKTTTIAIKATEVAQAN